MNANISNTAGMSGYIGFLCISWMALSGWVWNTQQIDDMDELGIFQAETHTEGFGMGTAGGRQGVIGGGNALKPLEMGCYLKFGGGEGGVCKSVVQGRSWR